MEKKIKIGLFIDTYFPMVDGVIMVVDNYARRLAKIADVTVFAPRIPKKEYDDTKLPYKVVRCKSIPLSFVDYALPLPGFDKKWHQSLFMSPITREACRGNMFIDLKNITVNYSQNEDVLNKINLNIEKGEFIGIAGRSGSGKTTLLETIGGMRKPNSGNVFFTNEDIYQENYDKLTFRRKLQIVFQFPENLFFEQDIFSEAAFGLRMSNIQQDEIESRVIAGLESVGFGKDDFHKSPFTLSGGQKRRLALACALVMQPEILLLDEPFSGLDTEGINLVSDILYREKKRGTTIIFVSHDPNILSELCSRILIISNHTIAFDGTPAQVYNDTDNLKNIGVMIPDVKILSQLLGMPLLENLTYDFFVQKLLQFIRGK